jgi:hypothetical protein
MCTTTSYELQLEEDDFSPGQLATDEQMRELFCSDDDISFDGFE